MMESENHWLLDIDEPCDMSLSTTPSPNSESNFVTHKHSKYSHNHPDHTNTNSTDYSNSHSTEYSNGYSTDYTNCYSTDYSNGYSTEYGNGYGTDCGNGIDDSTPLFTPDECSLENYMSSISELNREIEEFSKIVQTLALFKYYIKNRKPNTNVTELNKRFNAICSDCSAKIHRIEEKIQKINYENHYVMVNRKRLELQYSEVRNRFNLQDSSVKKLRILIDTFNTVIREYTNISKKLLSQSQSVPDSQPDSQPDLQDKTLLSEMNDRVKQIELLEQSTRDLDELFIDLGNIIKKRGDNISTIENEILLSSAQIEKGKDDVDFVLQNGSQIQRLYFYCLCVVIGTIFLITPSNLKNYILKYFSNNL